MSVAPAAARRVTVSAHWVRKEGGRAHKKLSEAISTGLTITSSGMNVRIVVDQRIPIDRALQVEKIGKLDFRSVMQRSITLLFLQVSVLPSNRLADKRKKHIPCSLVGQLDRDRADIQSGAVESALREQKNVIALVSSSAL